MNEASIIFPNQLFNPHPAITKGRPIFIIECKRYFTDFNFHKKKLLLHRASMQNYFKNIKKEGYDVTYVEFHEFTTMENFLIRTIKEHGFGELHLVDILDQKLNGILDSIVSKTNIKLISYESPAFLSPKKWLKDFFQKKKTYRMSSFYIAQRKRLKILVENNKPLEGKWSFDKENREKLPKDIEIPVIEKFQKNNHLKKAEQYINEHFKNNPGKTDNFFYPINKTEASIWLDDFLKTRLNYFGNYEDAISKEHSILFHSVLSPLLNIGLLTPEEIVNKTLTFTRENPIRFNSLEGFIRQIIGWREFIRAIYLFEGSFQKNSNFWDFTKKLPTAFYDASTGLPPVDNAIQKTIESAYCHHIERLMILGNFLLLNKINPNEVYRWFMEMFIDAYDWVMVPNVFGMSQYADGGLMSTKPYISSSNYILKMSDFSKGSWTKIFDALFWNFILENKEILQKNARMSFMIRLLEKKDEKQIKELVTKAKNYMQELK